MLPSLKCQHTYGTDYYLNYLASTQSNFHLSWEHTLTYFQLWWTKDAGKFKRVPIANSVTVLDLHLHIFWMAAPFHCSKAGIRTYWHDQLSLLLDIQKHCSDDTNIFADLDNYRVCNTPLATIPLSILTTSYCFTIENGCLGHYLSESIRVLQAAIQQPVAVY